ncbi:glutathione S-transferase theta-1a [Sphaeramia orbicularis]|uniref:glutathione S-transferase theta-1a n=1 Tax=Sphaeramia orbicularis TaxID=375764 RepID=UPI00117D659F|nr:glutathione S-transferase theta-3-like [Sphaeramia orbicularis]
MELYLDLHSQPCRAVFLFARATGIPFKFQLVDLTKGQQYSDEFGKVSVMRKVPVMKDGSFILTESIAILQYLLQKHSSLVPDHWYPSDLQLRARVNEYLSWQHMTIRAQGSKVFLLRAMFPIIMGSEAPKDKMDAAVEELKQSVDLLEQKFLQDKAFLVSDRICVADVVAVVELMQPVATGLDVFEGRPKLVAWRQRVKAELGPKLFDEAHEVILKVSGLSQTLQDSGALDLLRPKFQKMFS